MNWRNSRLIIRKVGLVIGLGIFIHLIFKNIQTLFTLPEIIVFHWEPIFFSVFISILVYLLQMLNLWLIYSFIHQELSIIDIMRGFSLALIPKYVPGFIWGYASRSQWYQTNSGIPQKYSWGASLIEIVVTVTTGLMVAGVKILLDVTNFKWAWFGITAIPLLQFCFLQLLVNKRFLRSLNINVEVPTLSLWLWLIIIINSLFQWILLGCVLLLVQTAFLTNDFSKIRDVYLYVYIFSRSWITGFLTVIIPNGLGIRELVLKDLLGLELGLKNDLAILVSTLSRLILFFVEGLWFIWASIPFRPMRTKK